MLTSRINFLRVLFTLTPLAILVVFESLAYPYVTSKVYFWLASLSIIAVATGFYFRNRPILSWWRNPVVLAWNVYVAVLFVTALTGVHPTKSLWGSLERSDGVLWHFGLLLALTVGNVLLADRWHWLAAAFLVSGTVGSLIAIGQRAVATLRPDEPWVRVNAVFGNPNYFAHVLVFALGFAFFLFARTRGRKRWWYLIPLPVLGYATLLTGSRGAVLACLAGVGVAFVLWVTTLPSRWRWLALGALVLVPIIGVFSLGWLRSYGQLRPLLTYSLSPDSTITRRLAVWSSGLAGVAERPLLGFGWDSFANVVNSHFRPILYRDEGSEITFDRAHNFFVDHVTTGGILLLAALAALYLALLVVWLQAWRCRPSAELATLLGILAANFLFNAFGFPSPASFVGWVILLTLFSALATYGNKPQVRPIAAYAWIAAGAVVLLGMIPPLVVSTTIVPWIFHSPEDSAVTALIDRYPQYAEELAQRFPRTRALQLALEQHPMSFALFNELLLLYQREGYPAAAELATNEALRHIRRLAPTHPLTYLHAGSFATNRGYHREALKEYHHAQALAPHLSLAHWPALEPAVKLRDWKEVDRLLAVIERVERDPKRPGKYLSSISFRPPRMRSLAKLFADAGDYRRAARTLQDLVELQPTFTFYEIPYAPEDDLVQLVIWYYQSGEQKKARDIAWEAAAAIPSLRFRLNQYLDK